MKATSGSTTTAKDILLKKGRGYLYRGKYPQVVVFTRECLDIDKLERCFGGNHYKHNAGYVWILSSRSGLCKMLAKIAPDKSLHNFERLIGARDENVHNVS